MPVYIIRAGETDNVKIGWADESAEARRSALQTAHYEELVVIRVIEGVPRTEKWMHVRFAEHHVRREWFRFVPEMMTVVPPKIDATAADLRPRARSPKLRNKGATRAPTQGPLPRHYTEDAIQLAFRTVGCSRCGPRADIDCACWPGRAKQMLQGQAAAPSTSSSATPAQFVRPTDAIEVTGAIDLPLQSRVRLQPAHSWLSKYAPLAEAGRLGTVVGRADPRRAFVKFDTVRRGAVPICASFLVADLIVVAGAQPADAQAELLA